MSLDTPISRVVNCDWTVRRYVRKAGNVLNFCEAPRHKNVHVLVVTSLSGHFISLKSFYQNV